MVSDERIEEGRDVLMYTSSVSDVLVDAVSVVLCGCLILREF